MFKVDCFINIAFQINTRWNIFALFAHSLVWSPLLNWNNHWVLYLLHAQNRYVINVRSCSKKQVMMCGPLTTRCHHRIYVVSNAFVPLFFKRSLKSFFNMKGTNDYREQINSTMVVLAFWSLGLFSPSWNSSMSKKTTCTIVQSIHDAFFRYRSLSLLIFRVKSACYKSNSCTMR